MQLCADAGVLRQAQPDAVQTLDIFRPQPWRMRAEVNVRRGPVGTRDFERERVPRLGHAFPGHSDAARELLGRHASGNTDHKF